VDACRAGDIAAREIRAGHTVRCIRAHDAELVAS
jgi:hypothetical protein